MDKYKKIKDDHSYSFEGGDKNSKSSKMKKSTALTKGIQIDVSEKVNAE